MHDNWRRLGATRTCSQQEPTEVLTSYKPHGRLILFGSFSFFGGSAFSDFSSYFKYHNLKFLFLSSKILTAHWIPFAKICFHSYDHKIPILIRWIYFLKKEICSNIMEGGKTTFSLFRIPTCWIWEAQKLWVV